MTETEKSVICTDRLPEGYVCSQLTRDFRQQRYCEIYVHMNLFHMLTLTKSFYLNNK